MSEAIEMIQRAKAIRERLRCPPNAVKDTGINLKPGRNPPENNRIPPIKTPPTPSINLNPGVLEYLTEFHEEDQLDRTENELKISKIGPIVKAVCRVYGVTADELRGSSRMGKIVLPRHIVFYLAAKHSRLSYPQIARRMGGKDHSTVIHGKDTIMERILVDEDLASRIKMLEVMIFANHGIDSGSNTDL